MRNDHDVDHIVPLEQGSDPMAMNNLQLLCSGDGDGWLCWGMLDSRLHRHGVGSALLMERIERLLAIDEERSIDIETSQHSSGFFERYGFQTMQVTPDSFAPGIDQVTMSLPRYSKKSRLQSSGDTHHY